jgi:hypothetical protein
LERLILASFSSEGVNSDAVQNVNYRYDLQLLQPLIEFGVPNKKPMQAFCVPRVEHFALHLFQE